MKIILSRKGFDSANGGCASPILPDGTLLSMPIPDKNGNVKYDDLQYHNISYGKMLKELNPRFDYEHCHLDPDIRSCVRKDSVENWIPAFGQCGAAQGVLSNAGVQAGDIFLFFGWFHKVELVNGCYRYITDKSADFYDQSDLQIIYGYMQIGKILTDQSQIEKYGWHPHAHYDIKSNALYIPSQTLTLNPTMPGCGVLDYRADRVLTLKDHTRATWRELAFLYPEHIACSKRKNSAKDAGLYYAGIWQELVFNESEGLIDWVCQILS